MSGCITERMETQVRQCESEDSKIQGHLDRMSGWRMVSQLKEAAWGKARRLAQTRHVS